MNWLRKKINDWLNYDQEYGKYVQVSDVYEDTDLYASGLSFHVYSATGGLVVKVSTTSNNSISLRDSSTLHIIPKDQDLAESLAKIITLEVLRG